MPTVDEIGAFPIWNSNAFSDREGYAPKFIIIHGTAGGTSAAAIGAFFQSTQGSDNPVSSHYVVGTDGLVVQCVKESDGAWAQGVFSMDHDPWWDTTVNPNNTCIAIEHCKPSIDNSDQLTDAQKQASFKLVQHICQRWNIPTRAADVNGGITTHASIDPVNRSRCPGPYPFDELYAFLQEHSMNAYQQQAAKDCWNSTAALFGGAPPRYDSGIAKAWLSAFGNGTFYGPPLTAEYKSVDWGGNAIVVQEFAGARCEWSNGTAHWFVR